MRIIIGPACLLPSGGSRRVREATILFRARASSTLSPARPTSRGKQRSQSIQQMGKILGWESGSLLPSNSGGDGWK